MSDAGRRGRGLLARRPSMPVYLASLVVLFGISHVAVYVAERARNLDTAEASASELVDLYADLAARQMSEALTLTLETAVAVAANPALADDLLQPGPPPAGCTLPFTGAGPFPLGHLDVIDRSGGVRCTSDGSPDADAYAGAPWLADALETEGIRGPHLDPRSGNAVLIASAPVPGRGMVATFLEIDAAEAALARSLSADQPVRFTVDETGDRPVTAGAITGEATIEPLGWTVRTTFDRDVALAEINRDNRQLLIGVVGSFVLLVLATYLVHLGLARPIQRLSAAVRQGMDGPDSETAASDGPAEVARIAEDFAELRRKVGAELSRRQEAERATEASRESYRRLFAANPLSMWIYDTETLSLLDVNDAAVAGYGYSHGEFLTMTILDIRPPEDRPLIEASVRNAPTMDRSGPWRHVRRDGSIIEVEITSHAVEFAGRPARFVMAEDVTRREQARRTVERTQRMESLGQLAGGIAHDFNNVLAVMLNYAEFAAEELTEAAEADPGRWAPVLDDVERIGSAGRRAATLTQQLLDFARGESAEAVPVDLNDVTRETQELLGRTLGEQVDLVLDLDSQLRPVVADPGQLAQVVINLAVNARDAMPEGGRLLVETANVDLDDRQVALRPGLPAGPYVRLRVSDTGVGMDAATRDQAFEPLFSTKARGRGTGLGLATVYGVVSRCRGAVQLHSQPGSGTTVTVLLPASDRPAGPSSDEAPPSVRSMPTGTVLLVEDDDDLRRVTERILSEAGHRVFAAAGGPAALELAERHRGTIDLLLTDVVMPDLAGPDLAVRLHQLQPGLRVLFMSGYAPPLLLEGGRLPLGATLVGKPFSSETLLERVAEVLDGPEPAPNVDEPVAG